MTLIRILNKISISQHLKKLIYIQPNSRRCFTEKADQSTSTTKKEKNEAQNKTEEDKGPLDPSTKQAREEFSKSKFKVSAIKGGKGYPKFEIEDFSQPGTLDAEFVQDSIRLDKIGEDIDPLYNLIDIAENHIPELLDSEKSGLEAEPLTEKQKKEIYEYESMLKKLQKNTNDSKLFKWEICYVCVPGNYNHPKNRKVKMFVKLKDLQAKYKLSDEAIKHIINIVQKRYNPKYDVLTLMSDKYENREDNRREIMRIVYELIEEGHKKFPLLIKPRSTKSYVFRKYRKIKIKKEYIEAIENKFKEDFDSIDIDKDGKLSLQELQQFFEENDLEIPIEDLSAMMVEADKDEDGCIDYEEFCKSIIKALKPDLKKKTPNFSEIEYIQECFDSIYLKSKKQS